MNSYERITDDKIYDGFARDRHEYRYKIAGQYVKDTDIVIDAASGTGYGKEFLNVAKYYGIDKERLFDGIILSDLNTWIARFPFDVFISIETIEHLHDYKHLLAEGRKARRMMIISTPITPTKHNNEFHVHDFTKEEIDAELEVDGWKITHYEMQDNQYGIWILTK